MVNSFLSVFLGLTVLAPPVAPAKDSEARAKLHALLDEAWEFDLREDPLFATSVGDRRFDIREFHDRILSGGTVTLPILEARIDAYIRSKR